MEAFAEKHSIGKSIAALRMEKGWTQAELAEKLQVSDKTVSEWEGDDALPSVESFPALAKLFDVSIDYLMIGKKAESQLIFMSKAEFCAKNNKPEMVKEIDSMHEDENGKTLVDYIVEQECLDVFVELCTTKNRINNFKIVDAVRLCILSNRLDLLTKAVFQLAYNVRYTFDTQKDVLGLLPEGEREYFENKQGLDKYMCILPDSFFQMLATDKRIKEETLDVILGKQEGRQCVWYLAFPYLIHQCYENDNKEMLSRLLVLAEENNEYAYSNMKNKERDTNYEFGYFFVYGIYSTHEKHGLVRILEKTVKLALERGDFDLVTAFNAINSAIVKYSNFFECYVANNDEIRIAKLKLDKSVTPAELAVQSTIHNGILCVDELLAINDFGIIKKALEDYPIHIFEDLMGMLQKRDLRGIYRRAIDEKYFSLAKSIVEEDIEGATKSIVAHWGDKKYNSNSNHLFIFKNDRRIDFRSVINSAGEYETADSILAFIKECKQRMINDLALKFDKEKTIGDLTKEYFEGELSKGNVEIVIIKLCVRLEAIFRSDYHYDGDFSDMLNKFCSEFNTYDDEGYDYDPETPRVLHKLRMQRNGIVHSEKSKEVLTSDELNYCIEYICRLG